MRSVPLALALLVACSEPPRESVDAAAPSSAPADTASAAPSSSGSAAPEVDVVTQASEPYTGAPVLAGGKVDGAALRARNTARLKADDTPVIAIAGDDPAALGEALCEKVVPKRSAATPVLIKPNIGGFDSIKDPEKSDGDNGVTGRTTDPEFVRGVIRCLKKRGHTKITVADGWGGPHSYWEKLVDVSGYAAMTAAEQVPLVCMCDDGTFDKAPGNPGQPLAISGMGKTSVPTLMMPKVLADHLAGGLFISVPKLKAHRFAVVSLGIKGMQGTVMLGDAAPAHKQKFRMHQELAEYLKTKKEGSEDRELYVAALEKFALRMTDVLEVEAPDVVLLEGTPAMQGDGFQQMVPVAERVAIGGTNTVRVDQIGAQFLGAWNNDKLALGLRGHKTSPLIEVAAKRFGIDFARTRVEGSGRDAVMAERPFVFKSLAPFVLTGASNAKPAPAPTPTPKPAGSTTVGSTTDGAAHARSLGDGTITLDGALDEPAWQTAPKVRFDTDWSGKATPIATEARFLWSARGLYAGFELSQAGLVTDTARSVSVERERLYEEDCVELFVGPTPGVPQRYFELELGPYGHFFDLAVDRRADRLAGQKREDVAWSGQLAIGTRRDAKARTAVIEVLIAAPLVREALKPGAKLPLALYRMEGKAPDRRYLAWRPTRTPKPDFHVPEAFGTLILDE